MKKLLFITLMMFSVQVVFAADADMEQVRKTLAKLIPAAEPDSIKAAPIAGLYEAVYGSQIVYMTADGRYMIEGDVFDVQKRVNLTENVRQTGRKKVLDTINENNMIVFKPKDKPVKHVITAFTDIDCGYCRKLHSEMKQYNDLGIEVRYVAFPRSGLQTPSYFKAVAVWCAKDRNKAMTFAKGGAKLEQLQALAQVENAKECKDAVAKHFASAREIGISGTPTLFMESGQIVPGYVPASRLIEMLNNDKQS